MPTRMRPSGAGVRVRVWVLVVGCAVGSSVGHAEQGTADDLVEQIVRDVVDSAVEDAHDSVLEHSGIDLTERGYRKGVPHRALPPQASAEARRALGQLHDEYEREITLIEEALQRELQQARAEFEREAAGEDKREKVREKRRKLEAKVDAAYARFHDKLARQNARFDEKRERIVAKERGQGRPHWNRDARGPDERDRGQRERGRRDP